MQVHIGQASITDVFRELQEPIMPKTILLARDHLERAACILKGTDSRSRQLRNIIERTITLMDELRPDTPAQAGNVLDFARFRDSHSRLE